MEESLNPAVSVLVVGTVSLVAVVAIWVLVTGMLASLSGWTDLANTFPGGHRPEGRILRRSVLKVGSVSEKGVTAIMATPHGLYLESNPLFRYRRPAVHVPWNRIRYVESRRFLWQHTITLDLGGVTTIAVRPRVLAMLREHGVKIPLNA